MKRKFYRGKLSTVVWNPSTGRPLATFVKGQFVTEDDAVADVLTSKGYHEVSLRISTPPELPEDPIQGTSQDVKVMGGGMSEAVALANLEEQQANKGKVTGGARKQKPKGKASSKKKPITRRGK